MALRDVDVSSGTNFCSHFTWDENVGVPSGTHFCRQIDQDENVGVTSGTKFCSHFTADENIGVTGLYTGRRSSSECRVALADFSQSQVPVMPLMLFGLHYLASCQASAVGKKIKA